jgi:hypothetical protein
MPFTDLSTLPPARIARKFLDDIVRIIFHLKEDSRSEVSLAIQ